MKVKRNHYLKYRDFECYLPGSGHNLHRYSNILYRGGRRRDMPGIHYSGIRGTFDFEVWKGRKTARSRYGIGRGKKQPPMNRRPGQLSRPPKVKEEWVKFMTAWIDQNRIAACAYFDANGIPYSKAARTGIPAVVRYRGKGKRRRIITKNEEEDEQ